MQYTITALKTTAIIGFFLLSSVQFFLVYNTYQLKDEKYFLEEKQLIDKAYQETIRTDLIFPGGQKVMDTFIWDNRMKLEELYYHNRDSFHLFNQQICSNLFNALRRNSDFDSSFARIIRKKGLRKDLQYSLFIRNIEIAFQEGQYVPLFDHQQRYPLISPAIQRPYGARINGALDDVNAQNRVSAITVSSSYRYNCRLTFCLHVEIPNRNLTVLGQMLLPLSLVLFSVLIMVLTFYITYRNWIRQKKLSEMKSDFINGITHEFHTPISAILVANKVLLREDVELDRDSMRSMVLLVGRQAERLQHLVKRVLDISSTNQLKLQKEWYGLHHLVEEILMAYHLKYAGSNLVLEFKKDSLHDEVLLDQFWFTTLLMNILDNAVKYNDKSTKEITVSTSSDKKYIYLSVADNGIGMSKEEQQHIFDKFYRHKQHQHAEVTGLGLGLYYVKQAVVAHHWKIQVESQPGTGSVFTVLIPVQQQQAVEENLFSTPKTAY
ncbi:MAG: HAMP domain-containing sensor histidine kinase [Candidatus Pseudobacter hemicellulosilyticus]|uniref:histidine kinase n=1 Tax=Candidatus Pseudobacter hemicellulosilyticus TaxID=3121375 RepID=A0AAJ6BKE2_9BACT|nr:MAG: HAMP domain-containing sensor histidine kinase [Pseudobacter sp.]